MIRRFMNSPSGLEWLKNGLTAGYGFAAVTFVSPVWPILATDAKTYAAIMICVMLSLVGFRFLIGRVVHFGNDPLDKVR